MFFEHLFLSSKDFEKTCLSGKFRQKQQWIQSAWLDSLLILSPPFIITVVTIAYQGFPRLNTAIPPVLWLVLIVGVDVAHVYSMLFRTYLDPVARKRWTKLFLLTPILCWILGIILYAINGLVFWQALAYLAVFHFVRQQYGLMRLYSRNDPSHGQRWQWLDSVLIYLTMLYPLVYWHTHLPRHFNWFIDGDFLIGLPPIVEPLVGWLYALVTAIYFIKEIVVSRVTGWNIPKNLVIAATAISWFVGIVLYNGDLAFTAINVLSHGIPYMALVAFTTVNPQDDKGSIKNPLKKNHNLVGLSLMIVLAMAFLCLLAWMEEGLWDGLIWREHPQIFKMFESLPYIIDPNILRWLVPLLAVPQAVHYVLDGFIWRRR